MRRLRLRKPSPAMMVAVVALFVALGGTAAAGGFGPFKGDKIIKKHSLSGNRLKSKTITGTQVNFNKLGTVPSAANANSVGGMQLTSFTYAAANGSTKSVVVNDFDGLTLKASCTSGPNNGLAVYADTAKSGATVSWSDISRGGPSSVVPGPASNDAYASISSGFDYRMMYPGGSVDTGNGSTGIGFAVGQIVYSQPGGSRVTVNWSYENSIAGHACYFTGTAVGAPSGHSSSARQRGSVIAGSTLSDAQREQRAR